MNPEQRRIVNKLKNMKTDLEKIEKLTLSMGYSWATTRAYIISIKDKINDAIRYIE